MKNKAWLVDALLGLFVAAFVGGSYVFRGAFLEGLELQAYDMRAKLRQDLEPSNDVVIIAIDDESIDRLGRWPWPRTKIADMIDWLAAAKPRVIGLDIVYSEPERNPAIAEIENLKARYEELLREKKVVQRGAAFETEFSSVTERLDTDTRLLASLTTAQSVVLPMFFQGGGTLGAKPEEPPAALSSSTLSVRLTREVAEGLSPLVEGSKPVTPIAPFLEASAGVGHVNIYPEMDGVVRREVPAVKYGERFYPSYALQLVMRYLGLKGEEVVLTPGKSVQVGKVTVPLDAGQSMLVTFNGPDHTFRYYSFYEVLEGKVSPDAFRDKIVILGPSATGVATLYVTPVAQGLPSVEFIANVIENMLGQRFLVRPEWAVQAELGLIAFFALFIMFGLPRLKAVGGATVTLILLGSLLGGGFYLFVERGWWVKVVYPSFLLLAGYLVIVTKRFVFTEKGKELVEASAIETNKMLGLSFQGQGMLDMAFEKFRLCPVDENMLETLYNLGLDFERKRQYAKAVSVYKHIETSDAKYKDIQEKIKTLSAAAEGAVFGGIGGKSPEGTVLITGGASKPMLGRYEIVKELGRGAMGIVYLGKDPKINRQVAIKTLMLGEGSSPEESKQIKERFFREAESAGTLNHPGIVKIYDAGEEQDICFIAMELLDGHDLTKFGTKESMLDPLTAMDYVARVAEALDFAHAQGIVHRDIKPANIMLLKDGTIRVADFGIARITASSKTATGTVMGTPSYMSPEQIAGRKVDGRSDLFSLGVALFELLTGEKPFKGGEGIGTLLFQIANDPEPEPLTVNPKMPRCASAVVHKALKKQPDERYQKGSEMAADLRACIELVKSGKDAAAAPAAAKEPPSSEGGRSPLPQRAAAMPEPEPEAAPEPAAPPPEPEPAPAEPAPEAAETVVLPPEPAPAESATAWMADAAPTLSAAAAEGAAAAEPPSEAPAPEPAPAEATMSFEPEPAPVEASAEESAAGAEEPSSDETMVLSPSGAAELAPPAAPAAADMTLSVEPSPAAEATMSFEPAPAAQAAPEAAPAEVQPSSDETMVLSPLTAAELRQAPAPAAPAPSSDETLVLSPLTAAELTRAAAPAPAAEPPIELELGARPGAGAGAGTVPPPPNPALAAEGAVLPPPAPSADIELGPKGGTGPAPASDKTLKIDDIEAYMKQFAAARQAAKAAQPPEAATQGKTPEEIAASLPGGEPPAGETPP